MIYENNEKLTHDSGKEFYAQAASNKPIIELNEMIKLNDEADKQRSIPEIIAEFACDKLQRQETIGSSSAHFYFFFTQEVEFGITDEEYAALKSHYTEEELEEAMQQELEKRGIAEDFEYIGDHLEHWASRWPSALEPVPSAFFYDIKGTEDFTNNYLQSCNTRNRAHKDHIIRQIAESVCEKIRSGQYDEYSRYDECGIYYLTDVSVDFPIDKDFNPAKDLDYDELDQEIDRALQENAFTYYHTNGGIAPGEGDTEYIIHLADDRRPSVYWKEYNVPTEEARPEAATTQQESPVANEVLIGDDFPF